MLLKEIVVSAENSDIAKHVMQVRREQEKQREQQRKEIAREEKERHRLELARRRRRDAALCGAADWHC